MRRFGTKNADEVEDEPFVTSDFTQKLSRGEHIIPTLVTVFFVHSAYHQMSAPDNREKAVAPIVPD